MNPSLLLQLVVDSGARNGRPVRLPRSYQFNNIVGTCLNANAASGAELTVDVKNNRLSVPYTIDLVFGDRIDSIQL